jgi:hypothetical protein
MTRMRWVLLFAAALAGVAAGVLGSCAIDDEVTWINGEHCTGDCTRQSAGDFACDVDSTCTPATGCIDWDCADESVPPASYADVDVGAPDGGGDTIPGGEDGGTFADADAEDDGVDEGTGDACVPDGGGDSRETAVELTLGVTRGDLTACDAPSRWFRFTVAAGMRFEVDLVPASGATVEFLLYAEDGSVVAAAGLGAEGAYDAAAGIAGTYLLRVRAVGDGPVGYSLTVRELPTR